MKKNLFILSTIILCVSLFVFIDSLSKIFVPFERPEKQSKDDDIFYKSPTRVNQMKPSVKFEFEGTNYSTNSLGFRDREFDIKKKKGTLRIAVLGDSFIEGVGEDQNSGIPKVLERILREKIGPNVEVMNCGLRGGSPSLYQFWIKDLMRHDIDYFIICLFSNDMDDDAYWKINNHYARTEGYWKTPRVLRHFNFFKYLFSYLGYATTRSERIKYTEETFGTHPFYKHKGRPDNNPHAVGASAIGYMAKPDLWKPYWKNTQEFLEECIAILNKNNKPYLFTYFPAPEFFPDEDFRENTRYLNDHFSFWLDDWAYKNNVPFLNFYQLMETWYKTPGNPTLKNKVNLHFNALGLGLVAKWLSDDLIPNLTPF